MSAMLGQVARVFATSPCSKPGIIRLSSSIPDRAFALPSLWSGPTKSRPEDHPVSAALSDEEALTRLKTHDKEALALLYQRHARMVFAIGFRILRDRGEAEDLVQTLFVYLYQKAGLYDAEKGNARAWITQKAYSRAQDRRDFLIHRQFYLGTDVEFHPDNLAAQFDLEQVIASKFTREQLLKALAELPEKQHMTLQLHFFSGLDLREISERLGDPLTQVRHNYYRGLDKLRRSALVRSLREGAR